VVTDRLTSISQKGRSLRFPHETREGGPVLRRGGSSAAAVVETTSRFDLNTGKDEHERSAQCLSWGKGIASIKRKRSLEPSRPWILENHEQLKWVSGRLKRDLH